MNFSTFILAFTDSKSKTTYHKYSIAEQQVVYKAEVQYSNLHFIYNLIDSKNLDESITLFGSN